MQMDVTVHSKDSLKSATRTAPESEVDEVEYDVEQNYIDKGQ